jgi:hypothetical protein
MANRIKKPRGIVSFGRLPFRKIKGITQSNSRRKKGRMDRGATKAPVREENNGKVVMGRQISATAQRTSQINSRETLNLPGAFISSTPNKLKLAFY